jgi:hypothetical protein
MANKELAYLAGAGFVDKRRDQTTTNTGLTTPANLLSISALRTRLLAIGGYYTATVLDAMTRNDMVYAVRVNDESAGI